MENQRVRLSKAMLKSGLLTLLREKTLNHISVYELCAASQINRTTFYKYYGSPSDLLNEIERDFLAQLDEDIKSIAAQSKDACFGPSIRTENPVLPSGSVHACPGVCHPPVLPSQYHRYFSEQDRGMQLF